MSFYSEYMQLVAEYMLENPSVRYGQALFNVLEDIYPVTCVDLANTSADPYYAENRDDERIRNFWVWFHATFTEESA
jgi:hypothetical protein